MVIVFLILFFTGFLAGGGKIVFHNKYIATNDFINSAHLVVAILNYVTFRFVFFDLIYNIVAKQPKQYLGTPGSSIYATFMNWISKDGGFTINLIKGFGFVVWIYTVVILINWYRV